jgi:type I restriction-modification system DNA methylase subunit
LATEEFGSVYESLLELLPTILPGALPSFAFKQAAGNERKTTGSYYTPSSLVECLLDSALDPVLDGRISKWKEVGCPSPETSLLSMKICAPACGSGHFLIAAAQRIARRLAKLRAGGDEPPVEESRHALREVISHCLYGVDANPMAVELCKVTLWLEATEPGKPLSFLDHHIQCGNSLLGATPQIRIPQLQPDPAVRTMRETSSPPC